LSEFELSASSTTFLPPDFRLLLVCGRWRWGKHYGYGLVDTRLRENDPSQSPEERAREDDFDIMVTDATVENEDAYLVLPRLKDEHISTAGSLCTFTYDVWRDLRVEVNTWELSRSSAIGGLLQDLGDDGQLSMRDLHINVTNRNEAHDLRQVSLFRNLHTLVIQLPHPVFGGAATP